MKKLISLILTVLLLLSLLSCATIPAAEPNTPAIPETPTVTESPVEPEREKIAIEYDAIAPEWMDRIRVGTDKNTDGPLVRVFTSNEEMQQSIPEILLEAYPEIPEYLAIYDDTFFAENIIVCISEDVWYDIRCSLQVLDVYRYADSQSGELILDIMVKKPQSYTSMIPPYEWHSIFVVLDKDITVDEQKVIINVMEEGK